MLAKMGCKEGGSLGNSRQGMTTNLQAYLRSHNLDVGSTTDLHGNSGWPKTNKNFGGVLGALRRKHQGGTIGTVRMDGPPAVASTTVTASSLDAGSDTDSGGREERRSTKKERERRE